MISEGVRTEHIYKQLKEDYLHSTLKIKEICDKYGINQNRCRRICNEIKKEEGLRIRPDINERRG